MDLSRFKENLKAYYDKDAERRNASAKQEWKTRARADFLALIKNEGKTSLLELGAGTGNDSLFFMENGLDVVATDLSAEMCSKCAEKGILAYEMDFYDIGSLNRTFDCIWALNSLLHVPKADFDRVLYEIRAALNDRGLFYMGGYGGIDSEHMYTVSDVADIPRFYAFYSKENLSLALEKHFDILSFEQLDVLRGANINVEQAQSIVMRKKP